MDRIATRISVSALGVWTAGATFRPGLLIPPTLNEWLPKWHLAYFISDIVEELSFGAFCARYEGNGRRNSSFDPRMALKILAAGNFPRGRTICDFRKHQLTAFKAVFMQVGRIAQEAELVTLDTLAIDDTKIRANTSKHRAKSCGRMRGEEDNLLKKVDKLCSQTHRDDGAKDQQFGPDHQGDELPEELQYR